MKAAIIGKNTILPRNDKRRINMKQTVYKAAAVQEAPVFLNLEGSIDKAVSLIEEAAS